MSASDRVVLVDELQATLSVSATAIEVMPQDLIGITRS
jgi:hypothetical protein